MSVSTPSVLFVCLGNICRSPSAEAVFKKKALDANLSLTIDSAGTAGYHTGSPPDERSRQIGEARGYDFKGLACRRVADKDFVDFDYILAMDEANVSDLLSICPDEFKQKVQLFMSFSDEEENEVPDPYYGGKKGFEYVLDLIESASEGLVNRLKG